MHGLLTYGIKNNILTHVSEVENGLKCGCYCPKCNSPLVAKNAGKSKIDHFSHHSNIDCQGYYETAIHLLVKDLILKHRKIYLPNLDKDILLQEYGFDIFEKSHKYHELITFDKIDLEQRVVIEDSFIVPDIIAHKNGRSIYIEIVNSHDVDEIKLEKIKKLGIPCIKISVFHLDLNISKIEDFLFKSAELKTWLFNPKLTQKTIDFIHKDKIRKQQKALKIEADKIAQIHAKERHRIELQTKFHLFDQKYFQSNCQLVKQEMKEHYPKLKYEGIDFLYEILNGSYWNGKIYNRFDNPYIFFKKNKIIIYNESRSMKTSNLIYSVLKSIQQVYQNNACDYCEHMQDIINFEHKNFVACQFKRKN